MKIENETLVRDGKYPVSVGDLVSVAGNPESRVTANGWRNARVVGFWTDASGNLVADVTRPKNRAGIRVVGVDRLTKQTGVR